MSVLRKVIGGGTQFNTPWGSEKEDWSLSIYDLYLDQKTQISTAGLIEWAASGRVGRTRSLRLD
jgi:hypothetical protein